MLPLVVLCLLSASAWALKVGDTPPALTVTPANRADAKPVDLVAANKGDCAILFVTFETLTTDNAAKLTVLTDELYKIMRKGDEDDLRLSIVVLGEGDTFDEDVKEFAEKVKLALPISPLKVDDKELAAWDIPKDPSVFTVLAGGKVEKIITDYDAMVKELSGK
ncbi:MAG: hypothetical protein HZB16_22165 [Armatimonadetes bacterium]|nr:hypothetical protein [Armatimonadota bacterium]